MTEMLTKETFLKKVFNFEENKEWKYEGDLPCLIDFYADWCGPCKMMAPHFSQVAAQNPTVIFAKIDTEASPRLSQAFNIRSIPTLVLMKNSTELARMSGALRATEMQQWLDQQLQQHNEN